MTVLNHPDPQWLQRLLETAVTNGWCTRTNCTTCASEELRMALGLLDKASGRPQFLPMTPEMAQELSKGLSAIVPHGDDSFRLNEPTRWVLYEVWRKCGDQYFNALDGTWAGGVLAHMRAHHLKRQDARRLHEARQSVKQRDWKE